MGIFTRIVIGPLAAYVVLDPGREAGDVLTASALCSALGEYLPQYMVPTAHVFLVSIPLMPNGKVDRQRLPAPKEQDVGSQLEYVAPATKTERALVHIWERLLERDRIGVREVFFELGGHSLMALRMLSRIKESLEVELPLEILMSHSTIWEIAVVIDGLGLAEGSSPAASFFANMPGEQFDSGSANSEVRDAIEHCLVEIWTKILEVESVSVHDNFIQLQGTRNLIAPMLNDARQQLGAKAEGISSREFEKEPTIARLTSLIASNMETTPAIVVPIQAGDSSAVKRPIFLVHAGGGYVFFYRGPFQRLRLDNPIYGVRAMTAADREGLPFEKSTSVEQLASLYIEEIRKVQSHGPYSLGGACFGGVIAFEMARQLQAQGERISGPLLLFEFPIRAPKRTVTISSDTSSFGRLLARLVTHLDHSHQAEYGTAIGDLLVSVFRSPRAVIRLTIVNAKVAARRLNPLDVVRIWRLRVEKLRLLKQPLEVRQMTTMDLYLEVTEQLWPKYYPSTIAGSAVLFNAVDGYDCEPNWRMLYPQNLKVHTLPGQHLEMMEEPGVVETAELVRLHLIAAP